MTVNLETLDWNLEQFPYPIDRCSAELVDCGDVFVTREELHDRKRDILVEVKKILVPGGAVRFRKGECFCWMEAILRDAGFVDIESDKGVYTARRPRAI